ncbi:MAG: hypothetical protein KKF62_05410 [Bacteroidetes bacterium]|nr:hypothetical protein [Bacteroidota bacterium]MBU1115760.1 hypothetical protein [Bacteroidota bacterium]MBU1799452.1 hypothetical protein [Bacteroidota bacterium]
MKNLKYNLLLLLLISSTLTFAQKTIKVGNVYPGEVELGGFNLSKDVTIKISGEGASFDEWDNYLNYYAWILDTETRNVVWRSEECDDYSKNDGEYDFDSEVKLKAGNYEVYFAAGYERDKFIVRGLGMIEGLFDSRKSDIKKFKKSFFVTISDEKNLLKSVDAFLLVNDRNKNALASFSRVGDSENLKKEFSLKGDTKISIYGIGEGINNEFYDFGYIYDLTKNKRVWMFNSSDGKYAGGGKKNVQERAEITLPKGSYEVRYRSDDSHSFDEWNVLPPDDPQYWGIVISFLDQNEKKNIIPFNKKDIVSPVIELTKVEDDAFVSQGFTLSKNLELRILAVGEGYKELVDYGWIENANTKEIVWKMNYRNTSYAGGAKKNRIVDEIITFEPGNYIAYYVTDDSHNFRDWNEKPPFEEDKWGISIYTMNNDDKDLVKLFDAKKFVNKNTITEITKVYDDQELEKTFLISGSAKIRIIAIGESDGTDLADYAWITDNNGKTVWKMKYRETTHAGGSQKNRLYNDVINLDSGKYKLHYKTDDSHSFEDWNSPAPDNPQMYGVTLLYEK